MLLIATILLGLMSDPTLLTVKHLRSQVQVRGGRATPMLIVTLENQTSKPLTPTMGPVEVLVDGKTLGTAAWERGVVWEANGHRRKFQALKLPLKPNERVTVKLFYADPGPLGRAKRVRLRSTLSVGDVTHTIESPEPVGLDVVDGGI